MLKRSLVFLLALVALFSATVSHPVDPARAQDPDWRVEAARPLDEIVGEYTTPTQLYIAPDGHQIAFESQEGDSQVLCVLDVADPTPRCVSLPREAAYRFSYNDLYPALRWSPDGQQIALIGMPFMTFRDTDLGLIDLSPVEPAFTLLTDDGYEGKLLDLPSGVSIEANPAFSPDGSQIAFEQTVALLDAMVTHISVLDLATGETEFLTRLPGHEDYERDFGSVISLEWSPDGSTLAFSLRHYQFDPVVDGVWRMDVATGDLAPLVSLTDALVAYQSIYPGADTQAIDMIGPVSWSPDGSRLLFWTGAPFQATGQVWACWLDLDSGDIHPVPLPETELDQGNRRGIWPMQAVWSPDGSSLLVVARLNFGISMDETHMLIDSDEPPFTALYLIDVASGDYTLLGHLPHGTGQLFYASWGPDNDVFAGGFYLKLAQD